MDPRERYTHPDQWKHYGRCEVCRRKPYCKTFCTANRQLAQVALREYIRKTKFGMMQEAMKKELGDDYIGQ